MLSNKRDFQDFDLKDDISCADYFSVWRVEGKELVLIKGIEFDLNNEFNKKILFKFKGSETFEESTVSTNYMASVGDIIKGNFGVNIRIDSIIKVFYTPPAPKNI